MDKELKATEEQLAYARVLDIGMKAGLFILVLTFFVYLTGILTPHIPIKELPQYWGMPVHEYLKAAGLNSGWAWTDLAGRGDFLNFIGIAFLSGLTILCYMRLVPILFRKKDMVYCMLAIMEILVLVFAASGIMKTGGH